MKYIELINQGIITLHLSILNLNIKLLVKVAINSITQTAIEIEEV